MLFSRDLLISAMFVVAIAAAAACQSSDAHEGGSSPSASTTELTLMGEGIEGVMMKGAGEATVWAPEPLDAAVGERAELELRAGNEEAFVLFAAWQFTDFALPDSMAVEGDNQISLMLKGKRYKATSGHATLVVADRVVSAIFDATFPEIGEVHGTYRSPVSLSCSMIASATSNTQAGSSIPDDGAPTRVLDPKLASTFCKNVARTLE